MRGFTLVEILVTIGIFGLIILALTSFEFNLFRQNNFYQNALLADQDARQSLRRMMAELRAAIASDGGAYPLAQASPTTLSFYSDVDKNGTHDQVRYFLEDYLLKRGVTAPTGEPVSYDPTTEKTEILARNLTDPNQIIFSYYDRNYAGTSTSLAFPVNIADIRFVKIALKINNAATYSTQMQIRSLKDNL